MEDPGDRLETDLPAVWADEKTESDEELAASVFAKPAKQVTRPKGKKSTVGGIQRVAKGFAEITTILDRYNNDEKQRILDLALSELGRKSFYGLPAGVVRPPKPKPSRERTIIARRTKGIASSETKKLKAEIRAANDAIAAESHRLGGVRLPDGHPLLARRLDFFRRLSEERKKLSSSAQSKTPEEETAETPPPKE